jgi:hypothetical protein
MDLLPYSKVRCSCGLVLHIMSAAVAHLSDLPEDRGASSSMDAGDDIHSPKYCSQSWNAPYEAFFKISHMLGACSCHFGQRGWFPASCVEPLSPAGQPFLEAVSSASTIDSHGLTSLLKSAVFVWSCAPHHVWVDGPIDASTGATPACAGRVWG